MSRLIARILLSIFLFPLAGVFFTVVFAVTIESMMRSSSRGNREVIAFVVAGATSWMFVGTY